MKIMVIEGNPSRLQFLKEKYTKEGHEVTAFWLHNLWKWKDDDCIPEPVIEALKDADELLMLCNESDDGSPISPLIDLIRHLFPALPIICPHPRLMESHDRFDLISHPLIIDGRFSMAAFKKCMYRMEERGSRFEIHVAKGQCRTLLAQIARLADEEKVEYDGEQLMVMDEKASFTVVDLLHGCLFRCDLMPQDIQPHLQCLQRVIAQLRATNHFHREGFANSYQNWQHPRFHECERLIQSGDLSPMEIFTRR